jgi:hypothetical protein
MHPIDSTLVYRNHCHLLVKPSLWICGESYQNCSEEMPLNMLRDVMYLYSRSNDPAEKRFSY